MAYFIYRLQNIIDNKRVYHYIGSTPNPHRRIRQHNQKLAGGAKCTSSKPPTWKFNWLFLTFMKKEEALSVEYHMKHPFTFTGEIIKGKPPRYNVSLNNIIYRYRTNRLSENINEQLLQMDITLAYTFEYKNIPLHRRQVFLLIDKKTATSTTYKPLNYKIIYVDVLSRSIEEWNYTGMLQQI